MERQVNSWRSCRETSADAVFLATSLYRDPSGRGHRVNSRAIWSLSARQDQPHCTIASTPPAVENSAASASAKPSN